MVNRPLHRFLVLCLVGLALVACDGSKPIVLQEAEIRECQGAKLSSVNDFRENSIAGPQHVSREDHRLAVTGLVERPLSLSYEHVLDRERYTKVVTLHCVEGWDVTILWEGTLIEDLLKQAGAKGSAITVIFHAADGYTSSLPLEYIRQKRIMLAHKMNGIELPPERGFPSQVVAESKWGYKWVKWVTKIELSTDADYRGYWESRGYDTQADFPGPVLE